MIELDIETLAYGGSGLGRYNGKAVFVPLGAPGDRIRCRLTREKKRYAEGEVTEILTPSPLRREASCPVFGECGGCQWQHLPYAEQCRWKERIFGDLLRRQAGAEPERILPIAPSSQEWHYRSRVQFKCRQTEIGFVMGFFRRGSHYVIDVDHCPISHPRVNEALGWFRRWLAESPCPEQVPQVDVGVDDGERVRGVVHLVAGGDADRLADFLAPLADAAGMSLFIQQGRKDTLRAVTGEKELVLRVGEPPLRLAYAPGGFAQVNLPQNRALVEAVLEAAALTGRERVLDLFCGMGNFSLPLARRALQVVGVEDYAPAIRSARFNARENRIRNTSFHAAPAEGALARHASEGPFELVVLDPPRAGAYRVARELAAIGPWRILYVSCDPATLARDLQPLLHGGGYRLAWSRPFDLFPQTGHIESLTLLERGR